MMRSKSPLSRLLFTVCLFVSVAYVIGGPIDEHWHHDVAHSRSKRAATTLASPVPGDRPSCKSGATVPAIRVNTTQRLADLRTQMIAYNFDAFIVLSGDAHGSEYAPVSDLRRGFISGFSGSAGYAAITATKAALWTDGRYFLEAEDALDCNWAFMKSGEQGVPTMTEWLVSELTAANQVVGADQFLVSNGEWQSFDTAFKKVNITIRGLGPSQVNPVDTAWGASKPPPPKTNINALELEYAGMTWQDKLNLVVADMIRRGVKGAHVVTALDEIAWLYNLRASDIAYNPFFISYAIVETTDTANKTTLYIYDKSIRLTMNATDPETKRKLYEHLNTGTDGSCAGKPTWCVEVKEYIPANVVTDIQAIANAAADHQIWVTSGCNYAIYSAIPEGKRLQANSYIALIKAQKNAVEVAGMQKGYNRDSAVLIEFLAEIEKDLKSGTKAWTEVSAAEHLKAMRLKVDKNRGLSFGSISGSGPNGAIIHYSPSNLTDRPLTTSEMYLLDSGGQYLDATTDVTRTMHYGTPSAYQKECYTRVLMGSTDLALMVWPEGLYGRELDMSARAPLWSVGLEYRHGTGHGIGSFLSVHEGPGFISLTHSSFYVGERLWPYMYFSDEPGFYEDGEFGIRLETVVMVEPRNTTHKFGTKQFLGFRPITLVPFEPNLIDYNLLSDRQIEWLNFYHDLTQKTIEPLLTTDLARNWLKERTKPYSRAQPSSPASAPVISMVTVVLATLVAFTSRN